MKHRPVIKAEQRWLYGLISWMVLVSAVLFLLGGTVMLPKALSGTPPHLRSVAIRESVKTLGLGVAFGGAGVFVRVMLFRWDRWYPRVRKAEAAAEFVSWDIWGAWGDRDRWLHRWVDWLARLWDRAESRSKKKRKRPRNNSGGRA